MSVPEKEMEIDADGDLKISGSVDVTYVPASQLHELYKLLIMHFHDNGEAQDCL